MKYKDFLKVGLKIAARSSLNFLQNLGLLKGIGSVFLNLIRFRGLG